FRRPQEPADHAAALPLELHQSGKRRRHAQPLRVAGVDAGGDVGGIVERLLLGVQAVGRGSVALADFAVLHEAVDAGSFRS
ncbi:hypothetical protein QOZ62_28975, partial [Pseudomonas aeruginosa]|uniref:hypothetical protein n=1 Tax=Pseudomonas aeruginosa TaxID=287 RepID=UPI00345A53AB